MFGHVLIDEVKEAVNGMVLKNEITGAYGNGKSKSLEIHVTIVSCEDSETFQTLRKHYVVCDHHKEVYAGPSIYEAVKLYNKL